MIRFIVQDFYTRDSSGKSLCYAEGFCRSNDSKPTTGLVTGSRLVEVDTGNVYLYNEQGSGSAKWVMQFSLQE